MSNTWPFLVGVVVATALTCLFAVKDDDDYYQGLQVAGILAILCGVVTIAGIVKVQWDMTALRGAALWWHVIYLAALLLALAGIAWLEDKIYLHAQPDSDLGSFILTIMTWVYILAIIVAVVLALRGVYLTFS